MAYKKNKVNEDTNYAKPPKQCGISGCTRETTVYIESARVSRCANCYQREVDNNGRSASGFVFEKGMPRQHQ